MRLPPLKPGPLSAETARALNQAFAELDRAASLTAAWPLVSLSGFTNPTLGIDGKWLLDKVREVTLDSATVDDFYWDDKAWLIVTTTVSATTWSGFAPQRPGQLIKLTNKGQHVITLLHLSTSSDPGDRIYTPALGDYLLQIGESCILEHDGAQWVVLDRQQVSAGDITNITINNGTWVFNTTSFTFNDSTFLFSNSTITFDVDTVIVVEGDITFNGCIKWGETTVTASASEEELSTLPCVPIIYLDPDTYDPWTITSIVAQAGRAVWFVNLGDGAVAFVHEDAGATAANRMRLPTDADYTLRKGEGVGLHYRVAESRWRCLDLGSDGGADSGGGVAFSGARVHVGDFDLDRGTPTLVDFDAVRYDTDSYHATTTRLTVPSAGKYHVGAWVQFAEIPTIENRMYSLTLQDGSGNVIAQQTAAWVTTSDTTLFTTQINASGDWDFAGGGYATCTILEGGGGIGLTDVADVEFWIHKLGDTDATAGGTAGGGGGLLFPPPTYP